MILEILFLANFSIVFFLAYKSMTEKTIDLFEDVSKKKWKIIANKFDTHRFYP